MKLSTAVVIPLYKQSQYVCDAIESALRDPESYVIVVADGCPEPATREMLRVISACQNDRLTVIDQPNRGLSGARNAGIKLACEVLGESLRYVFPLDADNILSDGCIEELRFKLEQNPDADWAYPCMHQFSANRVVWHLPEFSRIRQLYRNQCDAGSLLRRRVFDDGFWFDETMRRGYEDFELFQRLTMHGRVGIYARDAVFMYRVKPVSMLVGAEKEHQTLLKDIHERNLHAFVTDQIIDLENQDRPRYTFLEKGSKRLLLGTDLARFPNHMRETQSIEPAGYQVFCAPGVLELLNTLKLLPGLMFLLEQEARHLKDASIRIIPSDIPDQMLITTANSFRSTASSSLTMLYQRQGKRGHSLQPPGSADTFFSFSIGVDHLAAAGLSAEDVRQMTLGEDFSMNLPDPHHEHHADKLGDLSPFNHRFPWTRDERACKGGSPARLSIAIAVPWLGFGGVDACVLQLAKQLARMDCFVHLVVTEQKRINLPSHLLTPFETISFVDAFDENALVLQRFAAAVSHADVVINAHSKLCYEAYQNGPQINAPQMAYLHVVDTTKDGRLVGFPIVAGKYSPSITHFVSISRQMNDILEALEVPSSKISIIENAPILGTRLSDIRPRSPENEPLKILYAGRLDPQKGVERLEMVLNGLSPEIATVRVLGDFVMEQQRASAQLPAVSKIRETPIHDRDALAEAFREADIVLLPSRWEGVPLVMLDAMASGCLFIGTDVGAVAEVIRHGENGILVENSDDEIVAKTILEKIRYFYDHQDALLAIRTQALADSKKYSWTRSAEKLKEIIQNVVVH